MANCKACGDQGRFPDPDAALPFLICVCPAGDPLWQEHLKNKARAEQWEKDHAKNRTSNSSPT